MDASRRESFDSQHPLLPVSPSTQESQRRPYVLPPDNSGERKVWMDMDLNRRQEGRTKVRNLLYEIVEHEKGRKSPPAEKDIQALTDWKIEILELLDAEGTQPHHYNYEEYPKITMLLSKLKGDLFQSERYPLISRRSGKIRSVYRADALVKRMELPVKNSEPLSHLCARIDFEEDCL
ncbi:uncharacterized protein JCM6883_005700 [Sporobolomyces salmoneus]|uniref:uncharacterized protein n=1 Tax=Sporobolomyces salmoneus TaxID=183962 RepID=UPI00317B1135